MMLLTLLFVGSAQSQVLLGIRYGYDGVATMQDVRNMELWQGKKNATLMIFTNFCPTELSSLFDKKLPNFWNNGNIPLLSWQPRACPGSTTPNNIDALIAGGMYDSYILQFATMLKTFISGPDGSLGTADDRRVYIRLAHEMNGDWYPWSATTSGVAIGAGNTVADYIAMWRRVHGIVESAGLTETQVQWIFCPNATDSANSHPMEDYYPGDAYVDWVGIDGYNFGGSRWISPSARFTKPFSRIRALAPGKPLSVPEFGTVANTSSGIDIAAKNQWLLDAFSFFSSNGVKLVSYFNRYPINDWVVFGTNGLGDGTFNINGKKYDVFSAYKFAVSSPSYVSPDLSNPRLVTDSQFLGLSTHN
jgi:mannan endo-1,4-beta-mannosidase